MSENVPEIPDKSQKSHQSMYVDIYLVMYT